MPTAQERRDYYKNTATDAVTTAGTVAKYAGGAVLAVPVWIAAGLVISPMAHYGIWKENVLNASDKYMPIPQKALVTGKYY
jgi:hypothetical protein